MDQLLKDYDVAFDQPKREAIIREIDGILANEYHFVLVGRRSSDRSTGTSSAIPTAT